MSMRVGVASQGRGVARPLMRCGGGGRGHLKEAEDDEEEEEEPPHPSPHVDGEGVDLANELHLRDPLREPGSEVTGSEVTERGERSRNGGGAGGRVSTPLVT